MRLPPVPLLRNASNWIALAATLGLALFVLVA